MLMLISMFTERRFRLFAQVVKTKNMTSFARAMIWKSRKDCHVTHLEHPQHLPTVSRPRHHTYQTVWTPHTRLDHRQPADSAPVLQPVRRLTHHAVPLLSAPISPSPIPAHQPSPIRAHQSLSCPRPSVSLLSAPISQIERASCRERV